MKNVTKKITAALASALMLVGCAGEFSPEKALLKIQDEPEFRAQYSAPIQLGREVLTGDHHKNPNKYLSTQYASLLSAELIIATEAEKNAWRTVVDFQYTENGKKLIDPVRTQEYRDADMPDADITHYVYVCQLVPEQVVDFQQINDDTCLLTISVVERGITPFGTHLGFRDGRSYEITRQFNKGTFGWNLQPIQ